MAGIQMHCQVLLPIKLNCTKTREITMAFLNPFNLTEKNTYCKTFATQGGQGPGWHKSTHLCWHTCPSLDFKGLPQGSPQV